MKQNLKNTFVVFVITAIAGTFAANAEEKSPSPGPAQSHEQHHPEGLSKERKDNGAKVGEMPNHGMMGKMDMGHMKGMMQECMSMHKDGKMCDHQAMEKCQEHMKKGECQKMMEQAKTKEKVEKGK